LLAARLGQVGSGSTGLHEQICGLQIKVVTRQGGEKSTILMFDLKIHFAKL
jgi:hypothetical protein